MWRCLSLIVVLIAMTCLAAADSAPVVELHRSGTKELSAEAQATAAKWGLEFLKSANFNTVNQPQILKQSVAEIHKRYRQTVAGDYLVITYDHPAVVHTVGGDVSVVEIVIGLNRPDEFPSALFTIDDQGRVVAHEKYAGVLPVELRRG